MFKCCSLIQVRSRANHRKAWAKPGRSASRPILRLSQARGSRGYVFGTVANSESRYGQFTVRSLHGSRFCYRDDMSTSQPQPISQAESNGFRVEVMSRYSNDNSQPGQWIFEYTVRITNIGERTAQLISRHWVITDALDEVTEVRGPGVVGEQPTFEPGRAFQYSSWCPLKTPTGTMHGTYQMRGQDGSLFDIEVPWFALRAPYTVH